MSTVRTTIFFILKRMVDTFVLKYLQLLGKFTIYNFFIVLSQRLKIYT